MIRGAFFRLPGTGASDRGKGNNTLRQARRADMSQEFAKPRWPVAMIRRLRRIGLRGMLVFVIVVALLTGRDPEKLGDSFQIALPVLALGCALADGSAVRLVGRYLLLEAFIKTPKATLGRHPINIRPDGDNRGFPSGHTAVSVFGTTALVQSCLKNSPSAQAVAIIAGGFVGASRIESDRHNIWQVPAGALLGWLVQALTLNAFDRFVARVWAAIGRGFSRVTGRA
jgi:membrane-associated phospholipid phosphatase